MTAAPVLVVGGGLGCGKTTLLLHLLATAEGRRLAFIVNEFGDLGIDGVLLAGAGSGDDLVELSNGCVCCATGGDLAAAVKRLLKAPAPDGIVVELSGVADPYPVLRELASLSDVIVRHVVSLVDLETDPADAVGDALMLRRLDAADTVLLNKEDRAESSRIEGWRRLASVTNGAARVRSTRFGQARFEELLHVPERARSPVGASSPAHVAHRSVTLQLPSGLGRGQLEAFLDGEREIERAKGFVELREGRFVVQSVRGHFTLAPVRAEHASAPWNRLVFIGTALDPRSLRARASRCFAAACAQDLVHNLADVEARS
jgi:G3E family GTPase